MITDLYCNTCGKEVHKSRQYVVIKDHLWEEVCNKLEISKGLVICKDCIEKALGRKLQKEDYYNEEEPIYLDEPTKKELDEIYKEESEWYINHCTNLFNLS